jgi:hypothetical protein
MQRELFYIVVANQRGGAVLLLNITVRCQFNVIKLTFVSGVDLISVHAAEK